MQHAVAEGEAVQILNSHHRFLVVCHGDEAEAFALGGDVVADDLDTLHGPEGPEELPEDRVLRVRGQVVDEDAPAGAVEGGGGRAGGGGGRRGRRQRGGQDGVGQDAGLQRRVSATAQR